MNFTLLRLIAWGSLALVAAATLAPLGFRPTTAFPPTIERFCSFAVIGLAFALAYPRQFLLAAFIAIGGAVLLEVLQVLAPTRHGRVFDAAVKLAGSSTGLLIGLAWQRYAGGGLKLAEWIQVLFAKFRNFG